MALFARYLTFLETYRLHLKITLHINNWFFNMYGVASVIVTATLLPLLGFVTVCLRFYTRIRLTATFVGIDDWLIAFSCLLVLGQGAAQIAGMIQKPLCAKQNESIEKG